MQRHNKFQNHSVDSRHYCLSKCSYCPNVFILLKWHFFVSYIKVSYKSSPFCFYLIIEGNCALEYFYFSRILNARLLLQIVLSANNRTNTFLTPTPCSCSDSALCSSTKGRVLRTVSNLMVLLSILIKHFNSYNLCSLIVEFKITGGGVCFLVGLFFVS